MTSNVFHLSLPPLVSPDDSCVSSTPSTDRLTSSYKEESFITSQTNK